VPENGVLEPEALARYADAIVRTCVGIKRGNLLFVHGNIAHRELMVALAEAGYRAGAQYVDVVYGDPRAAAARVRYGRDDSLGFVAPWVQRRLRAQVSPDAAYVAVTGEADPGVYDDLPPERVARDSALAGKKLSWHTKAALSGRVRWAGGAWPTQYWASQVYPDDEPLEAQRRLGRDLLWFCRLTDEDGTGSARWRSSTARRGSARSGAPTSTR
jgi:aminopeptidase